MGEKDMEEEGQNTEGKVWGIGKKSKKKLNLSNQTNSPEKFAKIIKI
jgi:hypothetical protein